MLRFWWCLCRGNETSKGFGKRMFSVRMYKGACRRRLSVRMPMMSEAKNGSAKWVPPWHVLCRTRCRSQHAADATDVHSQT
jgi:hypothetical protein